MLLCKKTLRSAVLLFMAGTSTFYSPTAFGASVQPDFVLDQVVVSATRIAENTKSVPTAVTVITEKDIKDRRVNSVVEALESLPGIYVSQAAEGGILMRGFNSTDILVMKDGQQLNSAWNGTVDWNQIPIEAIKRIEVVRGASSSLYGGHAVGGVINIITREETASVKELYGEASYSYGTYGTKKYALQVSGDSGERWFFNATLERKQTDGFVGYYKTRYHKKALATDELSVPRLKDGTYLLGGRGAKAWRNDSQTVNVGYRLSDTKTIEYDYQHVDYDYTYHNPFSYVTNKKGESLFKGTLDFGTKKGKDDKIEKDMVKFKESDFLGYVGKRQVEIQSLRYKDKEAQWDAKLGVANYYGNGYSSPGAKATVADGGAGSLSWYPSVVYTAEVTKTWNFDRHTVVGGFSILRESFEKQAFALKDYKDYSSKVGEAVDRHGGKGLNMAVFVQDKYEVNDKVTLYSGLRYDYYKKYDGFSYIKGEDDNPDLNLSHPTGRYGQLSPKITVDYAVSDNSHVYVSYGKSFNPPILYKVYRQSGMLGDNPVLANPDLRPESSTTFEVGYKQDLGKASFEVNAYHIDTKDKVKYMKYSKAKPPYKRYENVDSADKDGIELSWKYQMQKNLSMYLNYAWQKGSTNGEKDYNLPAHIAHAGVRYTKDKLTTQLDFEYVSARQELDFYSGEYGSADAFFLTNLSMTYKLTPEWKLQFAVNNLFDRHFYDVEGTAGRTYTFTTRYSF